MDFGYCGSLLIQEQQKRSFCFTQQNGVSWSTKNLLEFG